MTPDQLLQAYSRKSMNFWAKMRTNLGLMMRSDIVDDLAIQAMREELRDILDSGVLSYPQTLDEIGIGPDDSLNERKDALQIDRSAKCRQLNEMRFIEDMAYKADTMRKSNWSWRIGEEAKEKQSEGWHPFFITLTINPSLCDGKERYIGKKKMPAYNSPQELWSEGREFRKYIRELANIVSKELGHKPPHKPPYTPESNYVTYAGVIEHGESREHHHGHFVVWLRAVPSEWRVCPNFGIVDPSKRENNECLPMRNLWHWSLPGLSPALYFRSVGDVWETKYNFVLPLKNGQPMKVSVPQAAGRYITKYLSKEHKEWHHRMKATRNLGMNRLKEIISTASLQKATALSWRAKSHKLNHTLMMTHCVPLGLIRSLAKQQVYLIKFRHNQLDLNELLERNSEIFTKMLSSVRSGARPDRMDSQEFFDWVGQFLPEPEGYCDSEILEAHQCLALDFPHEEKVVNSHIKIGGNKIGHT